MVAPLFCMRCLGCFSAFVNKKPAAVFSVRVNSHSQDYMSISLKHMYSSATRSKLKWLGYMLISIFIAVRKCSCCINILLTKFHTWPQLIKAMLTFYSLFWGCVLASYPDHMAWVWGYYSVQSITTCKPDTNSAYLGKSTEKMAWPNLEQLQQPLTPLHCFISCECRANLVFKYRSSRDKMATCRIRLRTTSTQLLGGHCGSPCNATRPNHQ